MHNMFDTVVPAGHVQTSLIHSEPPEQMEGVPEAPDGHGAPGGMLDGPRAALTAPPMFSLLCDDPLAQMPSIMTS